MELFELGIKQKISNRPQLVNNYNSHYSDVFPSVGTPTGWFSVGSTATIESRMEGITLSGPGWVIMRTPVNGTSLGRYTLSIKINRIENFNLGLTIALARGASFNYFGSYTIANDQLREGATYSFTTTIDDDTVTPYFVIATQSGNLLDNSVISVFVQMEEGIVSTPMYPSLSDEPGEIFDYFKVELDNKTSVNLKKYFEDISNPARIKNNISTTTYIPATASNNILFDNIWHLSHDVYSFDPTVRNDYILTKSGVVVDFGYIQLNKVVYANQTPRNYDITLYGKKFDFFFNLSDKTLDDLSVGNAFNHTINRQAVLDTWNPARPQSEIYKYILSYSGQYDNFDSKKIFKTITQENQVPLIDIAYDPVRNIWAGIWSNGMVFVNGNNFDVTSYTEEEIANFPNLPTHIYFDSITNRWVAVNGTNAIYWMSVDDIEAFNIVGWNVDVVDISIVEASNGGQYAVLQSNGNVENYSTIYLGYGINRYYTTNLGASINRTLGQIVRTEGFVEGASGQPNYNIYDCVYDGYGNIYNITEFFSVDGDFINTRFARTLTGFTNVTVTGIDVNIPSTEYGNTFVITVPSFIYWLSDGIQDIPENNIWSSTQYRNAGFDTLLQVTGVSYSYEGHFLLYSDYGEIVDMQLTNSTPSYTLLATNTIGNYYIEKISSNNPLPKQAYLAIMRDMSGNPVISYSIDALEWQLTTGKEFDEYEDDDIDEHVRQEFRSYYQRPAVRLKYIIQKILDDSGYEYILYPEFFNDNNPYWNKTWIVHSRLKAIGELPDDHNGNVRTGDSITFPQMIRRDVTQFKFLTDFLKMFGLIVTIDNPDNIVRIMTRNEFFNTNPTYTDGNPNWNYLLNSNGEYGWGQGQFDHWSISGYTTAYQSEPGYMTMRLDYIFPNVHNGSRQTIELQEGVEYTANFEINTASEGRVEVTNTTSGTINISAETGLTSIRFTSLGGATEIGVYFYEQAVESDTLSFRAWVNKGNEVLNYEPQEEQTNAPAEIPGVTINEITEKVDYSKEFSLEPVPYDYKYAVLQYDEAGTHYENSYYNEFNSKYGYLRLNTGYEFNVNENDWFNGLIFTNTVMSTEVDKYFQGRAGGEELYRDNKILPALFTLSNTRRSYNDSSMHLVFIDGMQGVNAPMRLSDDAPDMLPNSLFMWNDSNSYYTEFTEFPNVCKITVDRKASLDFARPAKLYYNGEYPDGIGIYDNFFSFYLEEYHNKNNKLITCSVDWNYIDMASWSFANFWKINSNLFHCISAGPYNLADDRTTSAQLIRVRDINNYLNGQTVPDSPETDEVIYN